MEFRTKIEIKPSSWSISYDKPVMLIGSCFSSYIGARMEQGHLPVMINPSGTVYNPVSVSKTLDAIISQKVYSGDDLFMHNGIWHSFDHYTEFSGEDPERVLERINNNARRAYSFLKKAAFLFITFGTARVYRYRKSGLIVSNCHKVPAREFDSELLEVGEVVNLWKGQLDTLQRLFPSLKVIFTISPVRHWKDGAHGNQVSKSVLFLAVEKLLEHSSCPQYFPAYELIMDELRDYRYYCNDMLHPSDTAVGYIWEVFTSCYFDAATLGLWNEVAKINRATEHRFLTDSPSAKKEFAQRMLKQTDRIQKAIPGINLQQVRNYFLDLSRQ
ncbi:MAG TPA: GSCFA domain-containing protein [Bacteroidales bacterium]|nr:GSCFA domain-containing protein [Bacteroidales bacterium]